MQCKTILQHLNLSSIDHLRYFFYHNPFHDKIHSNLSVPFDFIHMYIVGYMQIINLLLYIIESDHWYNGYRVRLISGTFLDRNHTMGKDISFLVLACFAFLVEANTNDFYHYIT